MVKLRAHGKEAEIPSPVSGKIAAINRDVEASPNLAWRDPYRRGWLLRIDSSRPEEVSDLFSGHPAKTWFEREAERLTALFKKWMPESSREKGPRKDESLPRVLHDRWEQAAKALLKGSTPKAVP